MILLALDCLLVPVAFSLSLMLVFSVAPTELLPLTWVYLPTLAVVAAIGLHLLRLNNLRLKEYDGAALARTLWLGIALGLTSALLSEAGAPGLPAGVHALFGLFYILGYALMRALLLRVLTELYRRSNIASRVAIYGTGSMAMAIARELRQDETTMLCAFIDENPAMAGIVLNGLPVFSLAQLGELSDQYKINRVILAAPHLSEEKRTFIAARLSQRQIDVQTLPETVQYAAPGRLSEKLTQATVSALLERKPLTGAPQICETAYAGASILITGAGGSIGRELCRQVLRCRPSRLVILELSELALYSAEAELRVLAEAAQVELVSVLGSVCDPLLVRGVLARHAVDVVFHAAAYKHVPIVEENARVGLVNNSLGTAVLAREAEAARVHRFVLVSTDKAVRPSSLMGASKRIAELVVQDLAARSQHTNYSIVRFGNVLGSSGSVIPRFEEQIARGGPLTLTDEGVTRYFMTIAEASLLVLIAGAHATGGEVFVLDMGEPIRIYDLARRMIEAAGLRLRDRDTPDGDIEIVTTGLRPGEKLHEELFHDDAVRATAHPRILLAQPEGLSQLEMAAALRDLRKAIESGSDEEVMTVVARAVHDYLPQNLPANAPQVRAVDTREAWTPERVPAE